jgi:hypothetical protein
VARSEAPNLIALQHEAFDDLPTVLVCPLKAGMPLTIFRVEVAWNGFSLIACPDLARPIRREALRFLGRLEDSPSRQIMIRLRTLLAR